MQPLIYHRPATVDEAVALLVAGDALPLAGGSDLIPQLREGRRQARAVVDLKHIPELTAIERLANGGWRIGAAASIAQLGAHAEFAREQAALVASARLIGSLQIQSRATLGGNLANAAPSADAVPLLISLGATAEIAGPNGRRHVPVADLPAGPGRTSLTPGDIIVGIGLAPTPARSGAAYLRFTPRREMDIAIAGAGVALSLDGGGTIQACRITLASVAPVPLMAQTAQESIVGKTPTPATFAEAARLAAHDAKPISDTRASADYRRHLVEVLTRRGLAAAYAKIQGGRT